MPMHEASHLPAWTAQVADAGDAASPGHGREVEETQDLCAWCVAGAAQGMALHSTAAPPFPAAALPQHGLSTTRTFVPPAGHWRFASRDPPPAQA